MSHADPDWQIAVREQCRMFRLAERDYGLTPKALHLETGIPLSTLKSWRNDTIIPLTGLRKLVRVMPDELTSLLLTGTDKHFGTNEPGEGCLDDLGREAAGFVHDKLDREADGTICHIDRAALKHRALRVAAKARAAAA